MNATCTSIKPRVFVFLVILLFLFGVVDSYAQKTSLYSKKLSSSTKTYTIEAEYPQMKVPSGALMGVRGMLMDFNGPIKDIITGRVDAFKKFVKEMDFDGSNRKSALEISYKKFTDNDIFFSAEFESFEDYEQQAHPESVYDTYNFDYIKWQPFAIKDIFLPGSKYLNFISEFSAADLKRQAKENDALIDDEINKGTSATEENYRAFIISADTLIIQFQYNQVAPHAFGAPTVSIPLEKLKDLIDPAGPLGYYVKK